MRKFVLGVLLCLGIAVPLRAQVDSLEVRLVGATGAERLGVLAELVEALYSAAPGRAVAYGRDAEALLTPDTGGDLERRVWFWKARAHEGLGQYDSVQVYAARLNARGERTGDAHSLADGALLEGLAHRYMGAFEAGRAALETAEARYAALGDRRGVATALHVRGTLFVLRGNYEAALALYERARSLREAPGDRAELAHTYNNMGYAYRMQGDYTQALSFHHRALALREALGDRRGIATSLNNIGNVHFQRGDYAEALSFYMRTLALREALGDRRGIATSLNNIGILYGTQGNYAEALSFHTRSRALKEALGDRRGIATSLNNMGNMYDRLGDDERALSAYKQALILREELGDRQGIADALNNIGRIYRARGEYEAARDFFMRSLAIKEQMGDREGQVSSYNNMAGLYRAEERWNDALRVSGQALALADTIGSISGIRDAQQQRAAIFERQGRFAEALAAFKGYKAAQDSLFNTDSRSVIADLQEQYRTREQKQRIALLERDRQIQRLWLYGLVGGLLLLAAIAFLAYNRYRFKNRAHAALAQAHDALQQTHDQLKTIQKQLIHAEKMASLGQLTAGIAHEIKNPLNFVNNFADLNAELTEELEQALDESEPVAYLKELIGDLKRNMEVIAQHGRRADGIVRSMMEHMRGGAGRREPLNLNAFVSRTVLPVLKRSLAQDPRIVVHEDYDEAVGAVPVVPQELSRVLLNLLGNAFDAVQERTAEADDDYMPTVRVSTRRVGDRVEIRVSDNGVGVPAERRGRIFEPFFTTKSAGARTGLGLSLAYDIVVQGHGGTLTVESGEGKGATFVVGLPAAVEVAEPV